MKQGEMMKEIILTKGKVALVDDGDFERVSQHSWCAAKTSYGKWRAETRIKGKLIRLHRFITNAKSGEVVHHINGNPLNNLHENLYICSPSEHFQQEYLSGQRHQKLRRIDVYKILFLYQIKNYTIARLAKKFTVTYQMIWQIIKKKTWKQVKVVARAKRRVD